MSAYIVCVCARKMSMHRHRESAEVLPRRTNCHFTKYQLIFGKDRQNTCDKTKVWMTNATNLAIAFRSCALARSWSKRRCKAERRDYNLVSTTYKSMEIHTSFGGIEQPPHTFVDRSLIIRRSWEASTLAVISTTSSRKRSRRGSRLSRSEKRRKRRRTSRQQKPPLWQRR